MPSDAITRTVLQSIFYLFSVWCSDTDELQWALEYDIIGVHKFEKAGGSEILMAHYWNQKTL